MLVCALHSFSRSWKHLQTESYTDCILEYASSTQAVQSSGSSFGSSCTQFSFASADMTSLLCSCSGLYCNYTSPKKDNIIHDHGYLLSTYRCWFICETTSVLAHSVMLYYILQTSSFLTEGLGMKFLSRISVLARLYRPKGTNNNS